MRWCLVSRKLQWFTTLWNCACFLVFWLSVSAVLSAWACCCGVFLCCPSTLWLFWGWSEQQNNFKIKGLSCELAPVNKQLTARWVRHTYLCISDWVTHPAETDPNIDLLSICPLKYYFFAYWSSEVQLNLDSLCEIVTVTVFCVCKCYCMFSFSRCLHACWFGFAALDGVCSHGCLFCFCCAFFFAVKDVSMNSFMIWNMDLNLKSLTLSGRKEVWDQNRFQSILKCWSVFSSNWLHSCLRRVSWFKAFQTVVLHISNVKRNIQMRIAFKKEKSLVAFVCLWEIWSAVAIVVHSE